MRLSLNFVSIQQLLNVVALVCLQVKKKSCSQAFTQSPHAKFVSRCVADPRFVAVHLIPESDNPEDDKIYLFFKENAIDGEHAGKATHARIGQLCKVGARTRMPHIHAKPSRKLALTTTKRLKQAQKENDKDTDFHTDIM